MIRSRISTQAFNSIHASATSLETLGFDTTAVNIGADDPAFRQKGAAGDRGVHRAPNPGQRQEQRRVWHTTMTRTSKLPAQSNSCDA